MTPEMNYAGYLGAREKLANMEARLAACRARTDLNPIHKREAELSYIDMIRQYKREIKLYEMHHPECVAQANGTPPGPEETARAELRPVE